MRLLCFCSGGLLVFYVGCGGDDLPQPNRVESYLTVIDETGIQRDIPASSLIDEEGVPVNVQDGRDAHAAEEDLLVGEVGNIEQVADDGVREFE